ncbi:MAG: AsnC family transcriptional regulator [Thermoproteota archaeon]
MKLDETDVAIIRALMVDGRMSFRQIARMVGVSTPTVENRMKRMIGSGIIKKIVPLLDPQKIEQGMTSLINLKVEPSMLNDVAEKMAKIERVRSVYLTTGDSNLVVRVLIDSADGLQSFMSDEIAKFPGTTHISTVVVTRTIKDEQGIIIKPGLAVKLNCEFCDKQIEGEPHILSVGGQDRYFCCKTCLNSYKDKYASKLEKLSG